MKLLTFAIITFVALALSRRRGDRSWESVAEEVDLDYTNTWVEGKKLHGHLRGFEVEIDEDSEGNQGTKLVVEIRGVCAGFTLGRDSAFVRMIKPDIETGDPIFDERTRIEGDADWALALLGDEARRLTEIVISGWNGELRENTLTASYQEIGRTASTLDTLLDLAQLLRQPSLHELPKLLLERACHDPSNSVRLQAFRRLTSSHGYKEEAHAAAETLHDSSSAFLRLEACRWLSKSSSEKSDLAAQELAELATEHLVDSSVRRSALETLAESRYRSIAISAMNQILQQLDAPPVVRTAALEGLVRAEAKTELLETLTDGEVEAEILARGLGRFDTSVQPRLIELLEDSGDRVRMAAVKSLGRIGDLDAIRALRQVAGQDRLFKSALAREAEHAIEEIKSRSGGSQQGEISILTVAPLEGAISPSDDSEAGGEVSLTS